MFIFRHILFLATLFQLFIGSAQSSQATSQNNVVVPPVVLQKPIVSDNKNFDVKCSDGRDKKILRNGWYLWDPYQFNKLTAGGYTLVGMDVELVKKIAERVGVGMTYDQVGWQEHQLDLKEGTKDVAAGATYTDARAEYVYFSAPYRYEENSLFMLSGNDKDLNFESISEFLAQVRLQNFILGVTKGFIYADPQINLFIKDESNKDIVREYDTDVDALHGLIRGEIDGFMSDRVVGAAAILNLRDSRFHIKEVQLNIKTPIHLMFSKKTVPLDLVEKFNNEIKNFVGSAEYKNIVKTYLYPVLLMQTIDSEWFYFIGVMGTIAFAISGIAIAAKENATLFTTFMLAMLPSVGGGIIRDVITNRDEVRIFLTPSYMYYIIIIVLVGFSLVRLLEYYNKRASEDDIISKFWNNILMLGDALGQAAFIITGVSIAIMAKIDPIELWGPFFAFLAASGGTILRDLIRKNRVITCLTGPFNAEIGIIWSLIFSIYLDLNSYNPSPSGIRDMVIFVVSGCFLTRLAIYYFNIPNITFRHEEETKEEPVVKEEVQKVK